VRVEGGETVSVEDAGAPPGTTIEVRDLFWNVPARRKFLKRPATEQGYALEAVLRLAIPRLDVGFAVREGERALFRSAPGATLAERAEEALGRDVRSALLPFEASVRGVRARGLAASPDVSVGNGRGIWLFVNGRAIRDRALTHAVLQAYGEVLPHGRYPSALVFLEVPPAEVDVNVHPAKAEVRLADARAGFEAIRHGIAQVLVRGDYLHLPGAQQPLAAASPPGQTPEEAQAVRVEEAIARYGRGLADGPSTLRPFAAGAPAQPHLVAPEPYVRGLRYLGQLQRTYLVCEGPRGLVLIDQHAAHERMNYQRLRRATRERRSPAQPLLVPLVIALPATQAARLAAFSEPLAALGVEVAVFDGGSVAIQALPAALADLPARQAVALLSDLSEELEAHGRSESMDRLLDALLARAACHASVRAHDALAAAEAQALLDALDETDYGARCAHGRPVVAEWTIAEVEKRFGRDYETHAHAAAPEVL
jgi:DNA mismatch repair protein MutL